jgi:hypothetical protein
MVSEPLVSCDDGLFPPVVVQFLIGDAQYVKYLIEIEVNDRVNV